MLALVLSSWAEKPLKSESGPAANCASTDAGGLPADLGQIVYRTAAPAGRRIYIIANGHRSALSGANAAATVQAQLETFRIGEWLIRQRQVGLLLPEGFFGRMVETAAVSNAGLDSGSLRSALEDRSQFVNAELLLHNNYGICLEQVEDRELYRSTKETLRVSRGQEIASALKSRLQLGALQTRRTAAILQSAPRVVDTAYRQGRISTPNAMLTLGLAHLNDIVTFLKAGAIRFGPLHTAYRDFPAEESGLELLKREVGVTVIVPRSLVAFLSQN